MSEEKNAARRHVMAGAVFGRLTVLAQVGTKPSVWRCRCACGVEKDVRAAYLLTHTSSCGCLRREVVSARRRKHGACAGIGKKQGVEYTSWSHAIGRCENPHNAKFADYGARGIRMCARWRASFADFLADMGPKPDRSRTIDRIDNDRGYSCGKCDDCAARGEVANCRWATPTEQASNQRRSRSVEIDGEHVGLADAAARLGRPRKLLARRLDDGMSVDEIVNEPFRPRPFRRTDATVRIASDSLRAHAERVGVRPATLGRWLREAGALGEKRPGVDAGLHDATVDAVVAARRLRPTCRARRAS